MADWDETSPADNDIVSQYPANERDARAAAKSNFGVDHHEANDADVGKHEVVQVMDNAADPTITAGEVGIWNNGGVLNTRVGAAAVARVIQFVAGTKQLFYQATAPVGWTQDAAINDRVLRVVSGAGGGSGGTWTISGVTVDNHTLTLSQIPAHNHGGGGTTANDTHNHSGTTSNDTHNHSFPLYNFGSGQDKPSSWNASSFDTNWTTDNDTHNHSFTTNNDTHNHSFTIPSAGGGTGHNHGVSADGAWRPSYIDVIAATVD